MPRKRLNNVDTCKFPQIHVEYGLDDKMKSNIPLRQSFLTSDFPRLVFRHGCLNFKIFPGRGWWYWFCFMHRTACSTLYSLIADPVVHHATGSCNTRKSYRVVNCDTCHKSLAENFQTIFIADWQKQFPKTKQAKIFIVQWGHPHKMFRFPSPDRPVFLKK